MAISQEERDELHELVQDALGTRGAHLLMAGLASTDLAAMEERLSLRIDNARLELRGEMADLRGEVRAEIGALRGEFGELRAEFGELRGEFGELRGEFGGLRAEVSAQTRWTFLAVFSANAAVAGLVLAALQLAG